jgi:hypothetical protein
LQFGFACASETQSIHLGQPYKIVFKQILDDATAEFAKALFVQFIAVPFKGRVGKQRAKGFSQN